MTTPSVFITGCSTGIGHATAQLFCRNGWTVYAGVRQTKDLAPLKALGCTPILCDLNDPESIDNAAEEVLTQSQHQCLTLIHNAGYAQPGAIEDITTDAMRLQFQTNFFGVHQLSRAFLPHMREANRGRIIFISSVLGIVSLPYRGAYNASKHALEAMASALRQELCSTKIKISVIQPGPIVSAFRKNAYDAYFAMPNDRPSPHEDHYQKWQDERKNNRPILFSASAEQAAKTCWHAAAAPRPRLYYRVTLAAYLLPLLHNCLPSRWFDMLARFGKF
jgi:NAD(P)-dependent dehydrogenase (short-subunit alcohol dehydrogenase family)